MHAYGTLRREGRQDLEKIRLFLVLSDEEFVESSDTSQRNPSLDKGKHNDVGVSATGYDAMRHKKM